MSKLQKLMRIANILREVKDIVATRWVKGAYVKDAQGNNKSDLGSCTLGLPNGDDVGYGYCGDGALRRVVKNEIPNLNMTDTQIQSTLHDAQKALAKALPAAVPDVLPAAVPDDVRSHHRIWYFNDQDTTTKEDMLAVYEKAIEMQCALVRKEDAKNHRPEKT